MQSFPVVAEALHAPHDPCERLHVSPAGQHPQRLEQVEERVGVPFRPGQHPLPGLQVQGCDRPRGDYQLSLDLLARVKELEPAMVTKSGIIVGMGETGDEVAETMQDLRRVDCDLLTIGQYLRPSQKHLPVDRFYTPAEFDDLRRIGEAMGFKHVASGPLVRSSYHADEQHDAAITNLAIGS